MTIDQAKQLYISAGGPSDHSDSEWKDIHEEMSNVVSAKSDRSAGRIILWWGCWDKNYTATKFARRVRGYAAQQRIEPVKNP